MRTFDTNVVVRIVLGDDPDQSALAARYWRDALASGGICLPIVVLIEVAWALAYSAKFDRARVLSELRRLTSMQGVWVENATLVRRAVERYAETTVDFADCLVLESARDAGALPVQTFDRCFARQTDVVLMTPEQAR
ncbi:MAG: PIN domain-containing protein [Gammaproteobacteria bacterium]